MEKRLLLIIGGSIVVLTFLYTYWSEYQKALKNDADKNQLQEAYTLDPAFVHDINTSEVIKKGNDAARKQAASALQEAATLYLKENPAGFGELVTEKPRHVSKKEADICFFLLSKYIGALPRDPRMLAEAGNSMTGAGFVSDCDTDYTTGFFISKTTNGKIVVEAPLAEFESEIRY